MVETVQDFDMEAEQETGESNETRLNVVYLKADDGLVDFLYRCKAGEYEVMLCLRCSPVFDKKAAKEMENARHAQQNSKQRNNRS